jgi:hypothetical protein
MAVFVFTRETVVHGATHTRAMGNVSFPLVLQGFQCRTVCAQLGESATSPFPWWCHLACFACFPKGFDDSWMAVFGGIFLARQD